MTSKAAHNRALQRNGFPTFDTLVARLVKRFDRATPADIEHGATWYDSGREITQSLASVSPYDVETCAAILSHLSPKLTWSRNVSAAFEFVADPSTRPAGVMDGPYGRALSAIEASSPVETFGKTAHKTRSFYRNFLGDVECVTVDIWAIRSLGLDETHQNRLGNKGLYAAVEAAHQVAAARRGVAPSTFQATVWILVRSGR